MTACSTTAPAPSATAPALFSASASATASVRPPLPSASPFVRSDQEWTTYMGDPARSGRGPDLPAVTNPHRTWTAAVDGDVYAEPLVTHDLVIVATEHNTVYALDPISGAARWQAHLGEPVPLARLACGNIDPNGITSTPVVDAGAAVVYAVAMLDGPLRHEMFALRIADGSVAWHRGVDPPGAQPRLHQQRSSLNLSHGRVYVAFGGFARDCGRYNGWVVGVAADGSGQPDAWEVPSIVGGAIWAPPGPVISATGDVWVATGNTLQGAGDVTGSYDGGNTVFRLDGTLAGSLDSWAPQNWGDLNRSDTDLGSVAPALLGHGLVFAAGKEGVGYLLRETHLGAIGGEVFKDRVCSTGGPTHGAFGGSAVVAGLVVVPCKDGLTALRVDASAPSFTVVWRAAPGANSAVFAYGMLWTVATPVFSSNTDDWSGSLLGLNPASGAILVRLPLGRIPHYPSPAAAGGGSTSPAGAASMRSALPERGRTTRSLRNQARRGGIRCAQQGSAEPRPRSRIGEDRPASGGAGSMGSAQPA